MVRVKDRWVKYVEDAYDFTEFKAESLVIDVGCGTGSFLPKLREHNCQAVGLDLKEDLLLECRRRGYPVIIAKAEALPIRSQAIDGVINRGVLRFTDAKATIDETARVLRPGGKARLLAHGFGYFARTLIVGPTIRRRIYALGVIVNTFLFKTLGRRLPRKVNDSVFQSLRQLSLHYEQNGLRAQTASTKRFAVWPTYIYQTLEKL